MDTLYYEQPVFLLFPIVLSLWQILAYILKKKIHFVGFCNLIFSGISVIGHAAAITIIFINGGTLYDALLLVLLSSVISLFLSPKENQSKADKEESN